MYSGTPITGYFMTKQNFQGISSNGFFYYLLLKCYRRQCDLLPLPGPDHLQNLVPKRNILNVFWIVSKRKIEQFSFFNWLSNVKNLVLSNASEHVGMRSNGIHISFPQNPKASSGYAPRPLFVMRLSYTYTHTRHPI